MPLVEISNAELVDKMTILNIKLEKFAETVQFDSVSKEFTKLHKPYNDLLESTASLELFRLISDLSDINNLLWQLEENARNLDKLINDNDSSQLTDFISISAEIRRLNDARAAIKRQINIITNSELMEEKNYKSSIEEF